MIFLDGKPVISDCIFDEAVTVVFGKSRKLSIGIEIGEELRRSVEIIKADELSFEDGWQILRASIKISEEWKG